MTVSLDCVIAKHLSPVGRWQIQFFLPMFVAAEIPLIFFSQFGFLLPPHHCSQPQLESLSWPRQDILNLSIPMKPDAAMPPAIGQIYHPCEEYNLDSILSNINASTTLLEALEARGQLLNLTTRKCSHGVSYDLNAAQLNDTLGMEFNIVCDRRYFIQLSNTIYVLGMAVGFAISGPLSDHFGRRRIVLSFSLITGISVIVTALAPNIWFWMVLRCTTAAATITSFASSVVLLSECTTPGQRNIFTLIRCLLNGVLVRSFVTLSFFIIPSWRIAYACVSIPSLAALTGFCLWQESPRWLLSHGIIDEAESLIVGAMTINGRVVTPDDQEKLRKELTEISKQITSNTCELYDPVIPGDDCKLSVQDKKSNFWTDFSMLLRNPNSRCNILRILVVWLATALLLYGLSFNSVRLGDSPLLIALLSGVTYFPGSIIQYLSYRFFDRKVPLVVMFALTSLCTFTAFFLIASGKSGVPVVITSTVGLTFKFASLNMLLIRTPEIFPTSVRGTSLGACAAVARIGMIGAVFVERFDEMFWPSLPMLIFSIASVCGTVTSAFLPYGKGAMQEWQGRHTGSDD